MKRKKIFVMEAHKQFDAEAAAIAAVDELLAGAEIAEALPV